MEKKAGRGGAFRANRDQITPSTSEYRSGIHIYDMIRSTYLVLIVLTGGMIYPSGIYFVSGVC